MIVNESITLICKDYFQANSSDIDGGEYEY